MAVVVVVVVTVPVAVVVVTIGTATDVVAIVSRYSNQRDFNCLGSQAEAAAEAARIAVAPNTMGLAGGTVDCRLSTPT